MLGKKFKPNLFSILMLILGLSFLSITMACSQQINSEYTELIIPTPTESPSDNELILAVEDPNPEVRADAARRLGEIGGQKAIELLVGLLGDGWDDVELKAIDALVNIGSPAIEPLIKTLEEGDWTSRPNAAVALSQIDDTRINDLLLLDLISPNSDIRESALVAVGDRPISKDGVELLIRGLSDEDPQVCHSAAIVLGSIKEPTAVQQLVEVLISYQEDMQCAQFAQEALTKIGEPSVAPMITLLSSPVGHLEWNAQETLIEIGEPSVEPLIEVLNDENPQVRINAIYSLGELKDSRAIEPLLLILKKDEDILSDASRIALSKMGSSAIDPLIELLNDENPSIRRYAIAGLKDIDDERVVEPIINALQDEKVLGNAIEALGELQDTRAVEPLLAFLADDDYFIREGVIEALGEIRDVRAIEPLIQMLGDPRYEVTDATVLALIKFGGYAVDPLIRTLNNTDPEVRVRAANALVHIPDSRNIEPFLGALQSSNVEVIAGAYSFYIERGEEEAIDLLIDAIKKYGTREMALTYLNCGQNQLIEAATNWANENGYIIHSYSDNPLLRQGPIWGGGQ